ncbi:MAG: glucoamylase family protein [Ferruginibacter sp.]
MTAHQSKDKRKNVFDVLPRAIAGFKRNIIDPYLGESLPETSQEKQPLRREIFTSYQLEQHAIALAKRYKLLDKKPPEQLLKRLAENEEILLEVFALLTSQVKNNVRVSPAAEWMLDNFYLIEEQIYIAKKHLSKGYSIGLPQLEKGSSAGLPRIYDIAVEIISHSDGHVNLRILKGFINSFQTASTLKIGELWALPIMIRLALLENLRRLSLQLSLDIENKTLATEWAGRMWEATEKTPKNLVLIIADMARSSPPMETSFVAELTRLLQEKGNVLTLALNWMEQRLQEEGLSTTQMVQLENQQQAASQVSISNSISSLRFLGTTDWRQFVEDTSAIEKLLIQDSIYPQMDFQTRDQYRHAVETIAKKSKLTEVEVARLVLDESTAYTGDILKRKHIGYYLVGKGIQVIEKNAHVKYNFKETCIRTAGKYPMLMYVGTIIILSLIFTSTFIWSVFGTHLLHWRVGVLAILVCLAFSQLALTLTNWLANILASPCMLPRMDFSKGIPAEYSTMVVVPTIISTSASINLLTEDLEVRYLANRDENVCYALLTDFPDSKAVINDDDEILLNYITDKITELNIKHQFAPNEKFMLFHRPRKYNSKEKKWMGYERKRGKIGDLNALLIENIKEPFSLIHADENIYKQVKYVITLDTDTLLPKDVVWQMVGTMAHPLNRPIYHERKKRVTEGYSILQPRVSNSLPGDNSSMYARMHGNEPGTDPYTKAVSDVYQDLFREGSFIGKGIYEIASFERTLKNRFPENRILSHDLLEGAYARSGLITDIQLYENYPSSYFADVQRRSRWVRGDWQIAAWLMPWVPSGSKGLKKNPLSILSLWKIADNLRRSFVPVVLLVMLIYGWCSSNMPWAWSVAVLVIFYLPPVINFTWQLIKKTKDILFIQHLYYCGRSFRDAVLQQSTSLICLPFEAGKNLQAILVTLTRVHITQRNLLQWNPSHAVSLQPVTIVQSYKRMWFTLLVSFLLFAYLVVSFLYSIIIAMPFLIAWFLSPFVAWYLSNPTKQNIADVSRSQNIYLRKLARKIWNFFEVYVSADDNWLPPDNYQEQPVERIAHRTSPTNIGLSLLSNLSALDMGFINIETFIERTGNTLNSLMRMEKFKGHLYNWYNTQTLDPLFPKYISTVDSGNMVGHFISLKQGILEIPDKKIISEENFEGLLTILFLVKENHDKGNLLSRFIEDVEESYPGHIDDITGLPAFMETLELSFNAWEEKNVIPVNVEENEWIEKARLHINKLKNSIELFFPWLVLLPVPEKFLDLIPDLPSVPSISQLAKIEELLLQKMIHAYKDDNTENENEWLTSYRSAITASARQAKELLLKIGQLIQRCNVITDIEYDFLYDKTQHLLTIGYNAEEHRKDNSYYDLLASEARLASFVAIAQGKIPQQNWFALGRQLTSQGNTPILLSWSGSMFEYLMPLLVMPSFENTLLDQTHKAVVQKQIEYAKKRGVPWGISESGYNMVDANLNYQYRAFGVPGLGFKRGLGEDLVIAPYACVMSLMVNHDAAYDNLLEMKKEGFEGRYGFYEAIDYTSSRLQRRQPFTIIKSFMAHHQGMSLLSIHHLLLNKPMQRRFEEDLQVKSALLLLQERIPRISSFYSPGVHEADTSIRTLGIESMRIIDTPATPVPEVQLLSNGRYHVMLTNSGGGYSRWNNLAITRWREDGVCDDWGSFCYIRDLESKAAWSVAYQPMLNAGEHYEAVFSQGRAEFRRRDYSLETHTEIIVSPEDDIEIRRVHITNRSRKKRMLEVTSYTEVVLATQGADEAHPAFSNLFVQTEINKERRAILCTRRPRSVDEQNPWMFHLVNVRDAVVSEVNYETDRSKFLGRGNSVHNPLIITQEQALTNSSGSVLDPIVSIQNRISIEPTRTITLDLIYGIADTKENCNLLVDKYQDRNLSNRGLELAWTHSQVILRQLNATESDAQLYNRLAGSIIFANDANRTDPSVIIKNTRGQSGLWSYAISGDLPIVLVQIEDSSNLDLVKQMVQAHAYWRLKGLTVDLVIWNEDHGGYRQDLQDRIHGLVAPGVSANLKDQPGGIFIRSSDQVSNEDRILFQSVAHLVISDRMGTLEEQLNRTTKPKTSIPFFVPTKFHTSLAPLTEEELSLPPDLKFFNGFGGFTADGKEYIFKTDSNNPTPAPWINVLGNPVFGSIISESGQSYTWVENAHSLRLTPWNNDTVGDLKGEAFYLRDEESGKFWSPTALPCESNYPFITRHGFGYSVFIHFEDGIHTELTVFVDKDEPIKCIILKIKNKSTRERKISVTGYVEWVLGDIRSSNLMHTVTEMESRSGAVLAKNSYNAEFQNRVAFFDVDDSARTFTTDRKEFIGRNGTLANPEAMNRARLSGKTGAALDPCAAIQVRLNFAEDEEKEIVFRLGAGRDYTHGLELIQRFKGLDAAKESLQKVHNFWNDTLEQVQVYTSDDALNILSNGWLNYQALACRVWARSGMYQSGGAFGFRDQLQDVLSLVHTKPELLRAQILLCASRQFREGDVQHWWHPPSGRGVRTTCSDDYLWLPFAVAKYIFTIGDENILDEEVYFLEGRMLNTGEESYYDLPIRSDHKASLYQHCVIAIEHGLRFGEHGLPFIGSGDWNDGMDKVGNEGKGESVWLAFFLFDILKKFEEIAAIKKDDGFVKKCKEQADLLKENIEKHAWDGEWYRRAYFDDGTPLGSKENTECKIDSIAQSWSVLSGAGSEDHTRIAMESAATHLVKKDIGIIQLFEPPFDKSDMNPGYIKGYVPGVRENGGQYTHAAIWLVMAYASMGDRERTWDLLQMINPLNRGKNKENIAVYKVEPYVIAADVYAEPMHKGRGGWTWYTGSSGWMYQLIIEWFFGIKRRNSKLYLKPCLPPAWPSAKIKYRFMETTYHIEIIQNNKEQKGFVYDSRQLEEDFISMVDDKQDHEIIYYV